MKIRSRTKGRELFLIREVLPNILLPYEVAEGYEEELIGEFENKLEASYFERFTALVGRRGPVLDLACGDGRHTLKLAERASLVVALDLSINNLKKARLKCSGAPNVELVQASMLDIPFRPGTFRGVWFSQAFEYVPADRRRKLLASLRRILRPSGILYMSVETWLHPGLARSMAGLMRYALLFCYWRIVRRKPLVWGEFFYPIPPGTIPGLDKHIWHYHVHTDKWTLLRLLRWSGLVPLAMDIGDGCIYVMCTGLP